MQRSLDTRTRVNRPSSADVSGAAEVVVENRLFATLDPLTRDVDVGSGSGGGGGGGGGSGGGGGPRVLLTDTVGSIRNLPHSFVASFRATLEEVTQADLLLHVIHASNAQWEEQRVVVEDVLADIGAGAAPLCYVLDKMDAVPGPEADALRARAGNLMPGSVFVSAATDGGLEPLRVLLATTRQALRPLVRIRLGADAGRWLAELYRDAEVVSVGSEGAAVVVWARAGDALLGRLRHAGADVVPSAQAPSGTQAAG